MFHRLLLTFSVLCILISILQSLTNVGATEQSSKNIEKTEQKCTTKNSDIDD